MSRSTTALFDRIARPARANILFHFNNMTRIEGKDLEFETIEEM